MENQKAMPVRVWLGYALPKYRTAKGRTEYQKQLGTIFIPATVQMMQPWGLTAYLPTVLPLTADKHPHAPDEIALVFYESCEAYKQAAHNSVAGRAYESLHATVFNFDENTGVPASRSGFPVRFSKQSFPGQQTTCFSLLDSDANWQHGNTVVLVAASSDGTLPLGALADFFSALQADPPAGLNDVILATATDTIAVWANWSTEPETMNLLEGMAGIKCILNTKATEASVPMPATAKFAGITAHAGYSATFQFKTRQKEQSVQA